MYVVRPATLEDLAIVVSWIRTADECERWAGTQVSFPIDLAALPGTIGFSEQNAYVMVLDGSIMAFGEVLEKPRGRQHLATLIVSPERRGRGYGRVFLHELLRRTVADRVSLNVNEDNSVAISLYAGAGFIPARRPEDQRASPRTCYMEWQRSCTESPSVPHE